MTDRMTTRGDSEHDEIVLACHGKTKGEQPMNEPTTDAEVVEHCRRQMQDAIDRTDWDAGSIDGVLDSTGIGPVEMRRVFDYELTELGSFNLALPERILRRVPAFLQSSVLRHYVYRHKDGNVYVIHHPRRIELLRRGVVTLQAFVQQPSN